MVLLKMEPSLESNTKLLEETLEADAAAYPPV